MTNTKDPRRQRLGAIAKAKGKHFEERLDQAFAYYRDRGYAIIEKTPEPMRPTKNLGNGKFIAFFEKKAQPDYKGIIKGGRTVMFEAKFTAKERMEQDRVEREQGEYLDRHECLGARCYVLAGFGSGEVYRVPWSVWKDMKEHFGRKYVTETDLEDYPCMFLRAEGGVPCAAFPPVVLESRLKQGSDRSEDFLRTAPYIARTQGGVRCQNALDAGASFIPLDSLTEALEGV